MSFEKGFKNIPENNEEESEVNEEKEKKFSKFGFIKIDGKEEQIGIGEVKELSTHIEVETLPGCSRVALIETMKKISNEKEKTVKAEFNNEEIVVEPENQEK